MRRFATVTAVLVGLGVGTLAYAQSSPASGQPDYSGSQAPASSQQSMARERSGAEDTDATNGNPAPATAAEHNTRLAALVPAGMSAQEACDGFHSITECVATLHAAQNCGVAFKDLKTKVTGGEKLGAALHDLKPDADVQSEVSRAEEQARADLRSPQG